jgi:hypothetical protein
MRFFPSTKNRRTSLNLRIDPLLFPRNNSTILGLSPLTRAAPCLPVPVFWGTPQGRGQMGFFIWRPRSAAYPVLSGIPERSAGIAKHRVPGTFGYSGAKRRNGRGSCPQKWGGEVFVPPSIRGTNIPRHMVHGPPPTVLHSLFSALFPTHSFPIRFFHGTNTPSLANPKSKTTNPQFLSP